MDNISPPASNQNSSPRAGFADPVVSSFAILRPVIDGMAEGFGLLGPDFIILELNAEAVRIDGRPREQLINQSHWDVYPGTEHSDLGHLYKQVMTDRVSAEIEHRYDWPNGRSSWFETRVYPVENGGIVILYRDVSARHRRQERLMLSERRYKAAVAAVDGVVWTNTADGLMMGNQPGWSTFTGQTYDAYQGFGWSAAVHPDDQQPTIEAWNAAVASRSPFEFEHRVCRHDGQWRLCSIRAVPVLDDAGAIAEWVGIHRDNTDTRGESLRLKQLAETIDSVFYVHEIEDNQISYASRAFEHIWQQSRDDLYKDINTFLRSVHPEDVPKIAAAKQQQVNGHSPELEYRLRFKDGSERIIHDRPFDTHDPVSGKRRVVGLATDITEFRRVQELLGKNANTFSELVKSNPFGVYVVDSNFTVLLVSHGARTVFSSFETIEGQDLDRVLRTIWPDPIASDAISRFRWTLETGQRYQAPTLIEARADTNEDQAFDWQIDRITLPDGQYGVVCHFVDVTEREIFIRELKAARAREALNAAQLDALYADAPLGLALLDADLRFVRLNSALAEMNGIPVSAHIGKSAWDLVPELRESAEPMLRRVIDSGETQRDVMVTGRTPAWPDQMRNWCEQFYPVHDPKGAVTGVGIIAEDVTDRERAAVERAEREDELRRVLDQLFAFVGILSPSGIVTYTNRAPLEAAGITLADVQGKHFCETPWWNYDDNTKAQLLAAINNAASGDLVRFDVPVRLGHDFVTIDFRVSPLRDHNGVVTGLIPSGVIIEDRVRAEASLRRLTSSLEEEVIHRTAELHSANQQLIAEIQERERAQAALLESQKLEAVGQLTAGLAHDFNNILASILSGLAMAEKWSDNGRVKDVLKMSASAAQRGTSLVKQLLAFARQQPLAPATIEVAEALEEARGLIQMAMSRDIELDIRCDDTCWPVRADPAMLQSALLNLAINARDAMPKGGRLSINAFPCAGHGGIDQVAFVVRDTGCGMPPGVLARVAEPFFTTKGPGHGTGLGVAMVHGFALQSGGTLTFESTEGVGTSATFTLPRSLEE